MNKNSTTRQHLERNSEKKKTRRRNNDESMNLTREFIRQFGAWSNRGNWIQRGGATEAGEGCRFAELVAAEAVGKSNGKENTFFRFADPTTVAGLTGKVDKPGVKGRPVVKGEGGLRTANKSRGVSISRRLWLPVSNDTVQYIIQIAMLIQL